MKKAHRLVTVFLVLFSAAFFSNAAYGQLAINLSNIKNSCDGANNGSVDVLVTGSTGTVSFFVFGGGSPTLPAPSAGNGTRSITNLTPSGSSILLVVQDGSGFVNQGFFISNITPAITSSVASQQNNLDGTCVAPNGFINVNVSGGTGAYNFAWTSSNGFTSTSQNISNLAGGTYDLTITDQGSNCTSVLPTVTLTDPQPNVYNVSTADNVLCANEDLVIDLSGTDNGVTYQVYVNGSATTTNQVGDGNPNSITYTASLADNDVITVRGFKGLCTPKQMSGSITVTVQPLPDYNDYTDLTSICNNAPLSIDLATLKKATSISAVTYDIISINPNGMSASAGSPVTGTGFASTEINDDQWTNNTASPINVVYTIRPVAATSCIGNPFIVTIAINPVPAIVLGSIPGVCSGDTDVDVTYTSTGSPTQYRIDWDAVANGDGLVDVAFTALPASPITVSGLPAVTTATTYHGLLYVTNGSCPSVGVAIDVTISPVPAVTVGAIADICSGDDGSLPYAVAAGVPVSYRIDWDGAANGLGLADVALTALTGSPVTLTGFPSVTTTATQFDGVFYVSNASGTCEDAGTAISIIVNPVPAIVLGSIPGVCSGDTDVDVTYTSTGSPTQYRIDWDAVANGDGLVDVAFTALPASPITVSGLPAVTTATTYHGLLYVTNGSCPSVGVAIDVTISPVPAVTVGAIADICSGDDGSLPYAVAAGVPVSYRIDWDGAANGLGLADVALTALTGSPVTLTGFPSVTTTATQFDGVFYVSNASGTCEDAGTAISIIVNPVPAIVLGSIPGVCSGDTDVDVTYTSTGSPTQYRIDWDAVANGDGLVDVAFTALPASPITVSGLPAVTTATTYHGLLYVTNGSCPSVGVAIDVTISPVPAVTVGAIADICSGDDGSLPYAVAAGVPVSYRIDWDGAANGLGLADVALTALTGSPVTLTGFPSVTTTATQFDGVFYVSNASGTCEDAGTAISIIVNPVPAIVLGSIPGVCSGDTDVDVTYTSTGSPTQYRIDWDAVANGDGLVDVAFTALPASPITVSGLPAVTTATTYHGLLYVTNGSCPSVGVAIDVTISPVPAVTVGAIADICSGDDGSLPYAVAAGVPVSYRIDWDGAANGLGLADVALTALTGSPVTLTGFPSVTTTATQFDGVFYVSNASGTCEDAGTAISIIVNPVPAIVLGSIPGVCSGDTDVDVTYTSTGSPTQYRIDWDAVANGDGLVDVAFTALPASPITVSGLPAVTTATTYHGLLYVTNGSCPSVGVAIDVTISPVPAVTVGAIADICSGDDGSLPYAVAAGVPVSYRIDWDGAANGLGLADVALTALTGSPVTLTGFPSVTTTATQFDGVFYVSNASGTCEDAGTAISIIVNPVPVAPAVTFDATPICVGSTITAPVITAPVGTSTYTWYSDAALTTMLTTGTAPTNAQLNFSSAAANVTKVYVTETNAASCESLATVITLTVSDVPTALLSGNAIICAGTSTDLTLVLTGIGPWNVSYSDGSSTINIPNIVSSPKSITVSPAVGNTTYSLVSVSDAACGTGTVSGTPSVTVTPIGGNETDFGTDTWIGYVYTDAGASAPPLSNIDFASSKYRGFIDAADIPVLGTSSYNTATDNFNMNLGTGFVSGTNVCGSYNEDFSIRFKMTKTFAAGSYTFTVGGDDGVRLFMVIGGVVTPVALSPVGSFNLHSYTTYSSNAICLSAGPQDLIIEYYEKSGNSQVSFSYTVSTPTITLGASPSVCFGVTTANLPYSATTGTPDQYSIDFDLAAETAGFVDVVNATLSSTQIGITVPGAAAAGTYNATLTVSNSVGGCSSSPAKAISVTIGNPTITLGASPSVCFGVTTANLPYSATTGTPDQYSIDFDLAAETAGFVDVVNATLPSTQIGITVPGAAAAGTYNATLTVSNSVGGCSSSPAKAISVTIGNPTITLGASPSVCFGVTTANLPYSATTGTPDQYSIDFDLAAETAGFVDVVNATLSSTQIGITVPGAAAAGTYNATLTVSNSVGGCSSSPAKAISVTIGNPTITLGASPSVCFGVTTANLPYSATTGTPDQYSIDFDLAAETAGFVDVVNATLPSTQIGITVPGAAAAGTYNATLTVSNSVGGCSSSPAKAISVTIGNPTITLGASPSVCFGVTTANLPYSATTGTPDQYSIDFDLAAETAGFVDVVNATLPSTQIGITVPGAAAAGTYNATLTVSNSVGGCSSSPAKAISVTIGNPTITLGASPSVCFGVTTANLPYSATTGTPDQYSIDFDLAAETAGFVDVVNATLPSTQIGITVPGAAAAGTYNATLTVSNSVGGCSSSPAKAISVTIGNPTITLGASPSVCFGVTTANLPYSATTGTPDQYSIDFDLAAETAGFVDVVNATLPSTQIGITVPGAAAAGTYNATLTVSNSVGGCSSSPAKAISVTIGNPTITLGASPSVCFGVTTANLPYSATTGTPDQYSIDFDLAAETAGFVDVVNATLPSTQIGITVPGAAAAGTYNATLTVSNSVGGCSSSPAKAISVTIGNPTITLGASPSVCFGVTTANLPYSATTGTPDQYSIDFDLAAETAGFVDVVNATLPSTQIGITVPGAAAAGTYNATLTVSNSVGGCSSSPAKAISVTIGNPTITLGASPSVCFGVTTANLPYSATTGTPDQYSIDFDLAAETAGFVDVVNATLPSTQIGITVPGAAAAGTYNATLTVSNSVGGCSSSPAKAISVTIGNPTITLGASPSVCFGVTTANLPYSATTGTPDQYSIDFDLAAETAGFVDVVNATLPSTQIGITVPGAAAAGTYNATLTVSNSVGGCSSSPAKAISVTIGNPTITLGASPSVCFGVTTANLPYSATTGTPDQYSIDFDLAAETAGFVDVVNATLPSTQIGITVPGAAAAGTYNATLTVSNSVGGCSSSPAKAISVTIGNPTITLGASPSVCFGVTTANLPYSATTGTPDQYSIDFDLAAETAGFVDVVNATLPSTQIGITVPGAAAAGTYNATLTVSNSVGGCSSSPAKAISVTIGNPTITLGASPSVCFGVTTANLPYSATTGTPDQYSIDFDLAAETAGFVDVVNATLPSTQIGITVPGAAAAGTYNATLTVSNSVGGCSSSPAKAISVTIGNPTITLGASPSVCFGVTTANLPYSATTGTPDQYSIDFDLAAETAGFVDVVNATLPSTQIGITVPGAAAAGTYNATLTVSNSVGGCSSSPAKAISVTIGNPTITLGASPSVCFGVTTANLPYSATTGTPDQYSIDFDLAAETAGFVDVVNATLPSTQIGITVPGAAAAGTYNATLTVSNSVGGCSSSPAKAISVTIGNPTITLGASPSVCFGVTTANLPYSATTGTPDQYSIDFDLAAETAGFVDVVNATLPSTQIGITVPGAAAAGTYNATLTVSNSVGGCSSSPAKAISVTIGNPTITLGASPSVCFGVTTANLPYSSTTGSPDRYSIDFNAAAEAAGFVDVVNATLTTTSIAITVPAAAALGAYGGILTVRNGAGGCLSLAQAISVTVNDCAANCFAFVVTVDPVLTKRPTCSSGQNNGQIVFKVEGSAPGNYIVTLLKNGVAVALPQSGPSGTTFSFANLSPASYQYKIQTQSGITCIQDFDLLVQSTVDAVASNVLNSKCFGQPNGQATITVSSGGNSPYEYSLDGVLWTSFVSPVTITNLPPSATPYSILVRDDASDNCPDEVPVTIGNAFTQIVASITPQTAATCNNNDGSVLVAYSGGDATAYTFELDGKSFTMPTDKIIRNLSGGNHILKVIDNQLCSITLSGTQFAVTSPGLIQFLTVATADPSCIGNGGDGMITVAFPIAFPVGTNEVAITQDADRSTPVFKDVPANGIVEYKNLSKGRYYVTVKSKVNGCPNERAIDILGGPSSISFTQEMTCELGKPVLKLSEINVVTGAFDIQITKLGETTSTVISLTGIPAGGIYYVRDPELPQAKGDYEVKIVQKQQVNITTVCTISSSVSRYTNRGSLTVNAANILPSYSDIATGAFNLTNFGGGTVPYYSSIRFDSASNPVNEVGFETDMEEVDSDPSTFGYIKKYNKLHAGRYHVTVNEEGGCSVEFDVRVPLDFTFSVNNIPNVFTPNGDGVNDFFFVRNLPSGSQLIISNRWGNEVYSSKSYQNDWNGGSAADGIYYYRLKVEGESAVTGWIEIQRGK